MTTRRNEQKRAFIKALAQFIAGDAAGKSIALELYRRNGSHPLMPKWPIEWAEVASKSPVRGWATVEEAERTLEEFLM